MAIEGFNEQGERPRLNLFLSDVEPLANDLDANRLQVNEVPCEWVWQVGKCSLGLELRRRLGQDRFWETRLDEHEDC